MVQLTIADGHRWSSSIEDHIRKKSRGELNYVKSELYYGISFLEKAMANSRIRMHAPLWVDTEDFLTEYEDLARRGLEGDDLEEFLGRIRAIKTRLEDIKERDEISQLTRSRVNEVMDERTREIVGYARYIVFARSRPRELPEGLRNDPHFMHFFVLDKYKPAHIDTRKIVDDSFDFDLIPENLRGNREFMKRLTLKCPEAFSIASDELRNDMDFVLEICRDSKPSDTKGGFYFGAIANFQPGSEICSDRVKMLELIRLNVSFARFSSDELKHDEDFVRVAYGIDPYSLAYFPSDFVDSLEGLTKPAGFNLKDPIEIDLDRFATEQEIIDFFKNYKEGYSHHFESIPEFMKRFGHSRDVIEAYLDWILASSNASDFDLLSHPKEFFKFLFAHREGTVLEDYEFLLALFKKYKITLDGNTDGSPLDFKNPLFRDLILQLLENGDEWILRNYRLLHDDDEIAFKAVSNCAHEYEHLSDRLKKERRFALAAVKQNVVAISMMSEQFRTDPEIMSIALQGSLATMPYLPTEILVNETRLMQLDNGEY